MIMTKFNPLPTCLILWNSYAIFVSGTPMIQDLIYYDTVRPTQWHYKMDSPNYSYSYSVQDAAEGLEFGASESRNGLMTKGEYSVLLPDGRRQFVSYKDEGNGYMADVRYEQNKQVLSLRDYMKHVDYNYGRPEFQRNNPGEMETSVKDIENMSTIFNAEMLSGMKLEESEDGKIGNVKEEFENNMEKLLMNDDEKLNMQNLMMTQEMAKLSEVEEQMMKKLEGEKFMRDMAEEVSKSEINHIKKMMKEKYLNPTMVLETHLKPKSNDEMMKKDFKETIEKNMMEKNKHMSMANKLNDDNKIVKSFSMNYSPIESSKEMEVHEMFGKKVMDSKIKEMLMGNDSEKTENDESTSMKMPKSIYPTKDNGENKQIRKDSRVAVPNYPDVSPYYIFSGNYAQGPVRKQTSYYRFPSIQYDETHRIPDYSNFPLQYHSRFSPKTEPFKSVSGPVANFMKSMTVESDMMASMKDKPVHENRHHAFSAPTMGEDIHPIMVSSGMPKLPMVPSGMPELPMVSSGTPELAMVSSGIPELPLVSLGMPKLSMVSSGMPELTMVSSDMTELPMVSSGTPELLTVSPGMPELSMVSSGMSKLNDVLHSVQMHEMKMIKPVHEQNSPSSKHQMEELKTMLKDKIMTDEMQKKLKRSYLYYY